MLKYTMNRVAQVATDHGWRFVSQPGKWLFTIAGKEQWVEIVDDPVYLAALRESKHWKANHDHIKLRLAAILTRTDIPREHVKAWQDLCRMLDDSSAYMYTLRNQVERLQFTLDQVRRKVTPESDIGRILDAPAP